MQAFLIGFSLVLLIVDSGFFSNIPFINKLQFRFPVLTTPLRCPLCASFWFTLLFVHLSSLSFWWLLLPFGADLYLQVFHFVKDLFISLFNLLSRVLIR